MRTFSARKTIAATPSELWPLIEDLTRHPEWSADPMEITEVGPGRYASQIDSRGRTMRAQIETLISVPDELLEFRVRDATGTYHHRIGLAQLETGTMVTRQVTPEKLNLGQQVLASAARAPIRIPALEDSLDRLAELATVPSA